VHNDALVFLPGTRLLLLPRCIAVPGLRAAVCCHLACYR